LSVAEREEREEKEKEKKKESNTKKEIKEKEKEEKEEGPKTSFLVDEINNLPKIKLNSKSNNVYLFYVIFNDLYQKKYHTSVLKSSKTMRMCKYIISCINQDYWEKVVTAFLSDNNQYLLNRQHDISLLAQDIQKYYNLAVNPEIKKVIILLKCKAKLKTKRMKKIYWKSKITINQSRIRLNIYYFVLKKTITQLHSITWKVYLLKYSINTQDFILMRTKNFKE
jgi:hypothetical protein